METTEPPGGKPRNSKLAAASLICFILSIPAASVGVGGRGSDTEWLGTAGWIAVAVLFLGSNLLAVTSLFMIMAGQGRVKGQGYAIATLVFNFAAVITLVFFVLLSVRPHLLAP